ncbi:hypothetical protein GOP47_0012088 [Adiantum capillus-veneris]|uniref:Glucose-6-phosphate 1-dehydrogenase n=1 Tax=Adiantum capillus-veneris TaxID=13818 RepID=A0A9D4UR23_ADICA|nr:hypothetical protein GOP47_0012088 [Adiantum capillus-veneris]
MALQGLLAHRDLRMTQISLIRLPSSFSPPSSWLSLRSGKQNKAVLAELTNNHSSTSSIQVQNHTPAEVAVVPTTTLELSPPIADRTQKDTVTTLDNDGPRNDTDGPSLSIIVVGATGELARSKIFPALFALFHKGCLPKNLHILGYSRSELSSESLKDMISEHLTCRVDHPHDCGETVKQFLSRVAYQSGGYDSGEKMSQLNTHLQKLEGNCIGNRIFYLSVPEEVLLEVASCVGRNAQSKSGWTRVIIEKPFGYDGQSSALQTKGLLTYLNESQIYRIDHRLGKDLVENLTVLRFSNLVFEPLWSRTHIRNVQVVLSEDWGIEGKGRYFDRYGIIRDIVQSHILQTIALFAMEPPVSLAGDDIRNEKVKVLRSMRRPILQDVVLGQYKASIAKDGKCRVPGYLDEADIPADSMTPTFVAAVTYIDNARWDDVPFLIKAGIGLIKHRVEIRIQFRDVPGNLYRDRCGQTVVGQATNELILQIQPDESIILKINNKVPGLGLQLDSSDLNLLYRDRYDVDIPDSYEHLIMDVIDGDNHLFIRSDELKATWDLLDPLLQEIEKHKVAPELYQFGGRGPIGAYYLGAKHGVRWADD